MRESRVSGHLRLTLPVRGSAENLTVNIKLKTYILELRKLMKIIILLEYGRICERSEAIIVLEELIYSSKVSY